AGDTRFASTTFNNESGTLTVSEGMLILAGGASFDAGSTVTIATGSTLKLKADTTVADAAVFAGDGQIVVKGGTLLIDGALSTALELISGQLGSIDDGLQILDTLDIRGGSLAADTQVYLKEFATGLIDAAAFTIGADSALTVAEGATLE